MCFIGHHWNYRLPQGYNLHTCTCCLEVKNSIFVLVVRGGSVKVFYLFSLWTCCKNISSVRLVWDTIIALILQQGKRLFQSGTRPLQCLGWNCPWFPNPSWLGKPLLLSLECLMRDSQQVVLLLHHAISFLCSLHLTINQGFWVGIADKELLSHPIQWQTRTFLLWCDRVMPDLSLNSDCLGVLRHLGTYRLFCSPEGHKTSLPCMVSSCLKTNWNTHLVLCQGYSKATRHQYWWIGLLADDLLCEAVVGISEC